MLFLNFGVGFGIGFHPVRNFRPNGPLKGQRYSQSQSLSALAVLEELGVGRQVLSKPYVTADYRVMSDGYAAQYRCVGIDNHIVLDDWMARNVDGIAVLIKLETLGTKRNSLIELHMIANNCSFSYDDTGSVVYAEILTDFSPGMDVYAGK